MQVEVEKQKLTKSNSATALREKQEIVGLRESEIEIGEDELRNEHDFYVINLNTNRLVQGRFIITRLKAVFVPYDKDVANDMFFK